MLSISLVQDRDRDRDRRRGRRFRECKKLQLVKVVVFVISFLGVFFSFGGYVLVFLYCPIMHMHACIYTHIC